MIIVKIGGGESINLEGVVKDIAGLDEKVVVVHGANALRDRLAEDLGKEKKVITSLSGYSSVFSDKDAIDLILMSYSGLQNKRIVELCQQEGINAIGLSGIDGQLIRSRRNKGIKTEQDGKRMILRDFSGKPQEVNRQLLGMLLENGYTPVLCIPTLDEKGFAINSENDDIVNVLHEALEAEKIIQLIEAPGFLEDPEDQESLVNEMTVDELKEWEEKVEGRMKRKMLALTRLFENNPVKVYMSDGRVDNPINDALEGRGTVIG